MTGARGAGAGGGRGRAARERGEPGGASEEAARETRAGGRGAPGGGKGRLTLGRRVGSSPPSSRTPAYGWFLCTAPQDSSLGDPFMEVAAPQRLSVP